MDKKKKMTRRDAIKTMGASWQQQHWHQQVCPCLLLL